MTDDLSTKTALVIDNGLFIGMADRLGDEFGRVLYFSDCPRGFPRIGNRIIGDGFDDIEQVWDIWPYLSKVDVVCFPDIGHGDLQLHLEEQGIPVWGSRDGDKLELNRPFFLSTLAELGLNVPEHEIVTGLSKLRDALKDRENVYLKVSRYRGDMETTHWRSWSLDSGLLDALGMRFGPAGELVRFIICDAIETPIECGGDTYNVDGRWPSLMIHGTECKDKAYFGAVTKREEMPEALKDIMAAFGPVLKEYRYRNQLSMEARILDDKAYFIDPCCRASSPGSASQWQLWSNWPQIVWAGAHGELVEPEPSAQYSAEIVLKLKSEKNAWGTVELPTELEDWTVFGGCCRIDGRLCFPPDDSHGDEVGWLLATGDTPAETIALLKEHVAMLPDGLSGDMSALADAIKEIEAEEKAGIDFASKPMPDPAIVLEDA